MATNISNEMYHVCLWVLALLQQGRQHLALLQSLQTSTQLKTLLMLSFNATVGTLLL